MTYLDPRRWGSPGLCAMLTMSLAFAAAAQPVDKAPASPPAVASAVSAVGAKKENVVRPRIGLALSGGGARGFSHVGVLRALESMRVPVDCIAGTSAGSAVGAAYAVGLSPDVIEARLREADWDGDMFRDQPPRPELPYRNKSRVGGDPIGVSFGVGADGVKGSSGIFAGQQTELFLHRMLEVSQELSSFDQLPVPFRAVATDLVDGRMAVQSKGSLVHAVRASMAVPSAFAPVRVGDRLLVDGALSQNLPVQAVREACADVVIAVNIGSPLLGADELGGIFSVALQVISILMERNVQDSLATLEPQDVLIAPDLTGFSVVDFARGVDGIPAGERATLAAAERLKALALTPKDYQAWQAQRQARALPQPLVAGVDVKPTRFVNPAYFALTTHSKGETAGPVDTAGLHRRIRQWTGSGSFTSIAYSVGPAADGEGWRLLIDAQEKPWGPDYLQVGFAGQVDSHGYTDFSAQAVLRRTWLNDWGAEWLTVVRFGRTRDLETRLFQPMGANSSWFLEPRLGLSTTPQRVFVGDRAVGEFSIGRKDVELRGGVQGTAGQAVIGLVAARMQTEPEIGLLTVPATRASIHGLRLSMAYDQLDDLDFPRHGQAVRVDSYRALAALGADEPNYQRHEIDSVIARSYGEHTWRLRARWAGVAGADGNARDFVGVGGFLDLSGYQQGQFLGKNVSLLSLGYARRVLALPQPFGSGLFAGVAVEAARIGRPLGIDAHALNRYGLVAYGGAATALGPAYLGFGIGQNGNRAVYLLLGRP
ncbi:patatin-like phospholipase family protein [Roseateles albus]|uniref:Patatin-like phospholipase family protein n=1 Tax=Roseateles albus TaxID=2987525 RepID=A0ABT5KGE8_9BURK|nr:patatin-like phospholipase family protein [Roseateles albus]MDC8773006.1 patatin-like phospholipase family protein [Roseateles albus]